MGFIHAGWLGGSAFHFSPFGLLVIYGCLAYLLVAIPLSVHRRLRRRALVGSIAVYLFGVAVYSVLSIPVLRSFLAIGLLKFGGSYNMARDITWGAAQFIVALALFEYFAAKIKAQNSGTRH